MERNKLIRALIIGALLLAIAPIHLAAAQGPAPAQVAVLLILDNSGSMADSDPTDLRFTAAKLFMALLDEGDMVGLILFSTESHPLTDGLVTIRSAADKVDLVRRLQPMPADGWTDVKAAFADARAMLSRADLTGRKTVVVFLTDGKPEIASPYPEYEGETLGLARSLGVPVLSIALTPAAQTPFLNRMAAETGGTVVPADDASDLLDAYLEVFSQVKDRTVMGSGEAGAPGMARLELDPALAPYVEKAGFILSKPEGVAAQLLGPDGREVRQGDPGVSFALTDDPRFAVVTVEQPAGGPWGFRLEGSGAVQARAILRSRLRVEVVAPGGFHELGQPMPIVVHLIEEQPDGRVIKIIGQASFSALITRPDERQESLDRFYDDGTDGDAVAGDGEYTRLYVNVDQPGTYTIAIHGRKGVVPVERIAHVEVVPFPQLVVDAPLDARYDIRSDPIPLQVRLEGGTPPLLDRGEIIARLTAPSGAVHEVAMRADGGTYTGAFLPTEDGVYQVEFVPQEATYKGLPYTHVAHARFEARIVPTISIEVERVDLGRVEIVSATQGLTITVPVRSTSRRSETLSVRLEGMPDWVLAEAGLLSVPPGGERRLILHLVAQPEASPGTVEGRLVFTAR
ncbi:MAG TPA: VWA domain-containing protein, partial [Anaerolineae bacterium]|nr:VWA domain-containing protein [Anaerolineae bacterium]